MASKINSNDFNCLNHLSNNNKLLFAQADAYLIGLLAVIMRIGAQKSGYHQTAYDSWNMFLIRLIGW